MLVAKRASKTSPPQTPRVSGSPSSDVPALTLWVLTCSACGVLPTEVGTPLLRSDGTRILRWPEDTFSLQARASERRPAIPRVL